MPDLLSGIPWEWIPADGGPIAQVSKTLRYMKGLRLLRILRLLRLMRMGLLGDAVEVVVESNRLFVFGTGVFRVLFLLFGITHWAACAWYMVGTSPGDAKDNWIDHFMHDVGDIATRYGYALYFTLTTMTTVGYGDIAAQNFTEVKFVLLLLLVASIVFAGLMGALTDLVSQLNNDSNERSTKKVQLSRYMRWRAVPHELFMSVREHLVFMWDTNEFDDYEGYIKEQLPPNLKKELSYHIYGRILCTSPFLAWMRGCEVCLKELALSVKSLFLARGDYLFHVGAANEHIYVVLKGSVYISQNEKLDNHEFSTGVSQELLKEGTGFSIPRNKEANAVDVMKMVVNAFKLTANKKDDHEKKKLERVSDMLKLPTLVDDEHDSDQDWVTNEEAVDILESHVDSRVLNAAYKKLERRDNKLYNAAKYIQRRWRRNHGMVFHATGAQKGLSNVRSKYVHAPAYLGESCLWQPLDEWDTYQHYPYAARCVSRGEFCYLHRQDVKNIIDCFSPWLAQRFEYFRQSVLENIQKIEEGKQAGESLQSSPENKNEVAKQTKVDKVQNYNDLDTRRPLTPRDMATQEFWPQPSDPAVVPKLRLASSSPNEVGGHLAPESSYLRDACSGSHLYGVGSANPLGLVLSQRTASKQPSRTFRMAAQKAVARIAKHVNPPSSREPTPKVTPRGTPRSVEDPRRPCKPQTLQEPLLLHNQNQ